MLWVSHQPLALCLEYLLETHSEHHIASCLDLACHEGLHRVQLALSDGKPVLVAHHHRKVWFLNATRNQFTGLIGDFERPFASLIAADIPLNDLVHTCCCGRIK